LIIFPLIKHLAEGLEDACWRGELEHDIESLWFPQKRIADRLERHGVGVAPAEVLYNLELHQ